MPEASHVPDTPADSPLTLHDVMASSEHQDLSAAKLSVGDPAFPFRLPVLGGEAGASISLSDFAGQRPVALIFGSYT